MKGIILHVNYSAVKFAYALTADPLSFFNEMEKTSFNTANWFITYGEVMNLVVVHNVASFIEAFNKDVNQFRINNTRVIRSRMA